MLWRNHLFDISWFMRLSPRMDGIRAMQEQLPSSNEPIARQANKEDNYKNKFFEYRFVSQALLDEAALLACSCYVDLNPIRAGIAEPPEESDDTSIQQRIKSYQNNKLPKALYTPSLVIHKSQCLRAYLAPLRITSI